MPLCDFEGCQGEAVQVLAVDQGYGTEKYFVRCGEHTSPCDRGGRILYMFTVTAYALEEGLALFGLEIARRVHGL